MSLCILHICNDFTGSKVHKSLYQKLDDLGISQYIYTSFRNQMLEGKNYFDAQNTQFVYAPILKLYHRFFFKKKIQDEYIDIQNKIDITKIDCIHATTLFSDGAVALKLKKKYNIPYIVAVRNSDINAFLKYAPHLWNVHRQVLLEASYVIFISPSIQDRLLAHFTIRDIRDKIARKGILLPNGIDDFWRNHVEKRRVVSNMDVAYIGRFDSNKNVIRLMKAVLGLKKTIPSIKLNLVGGGGSQEKRVKQYIKRFPDVFSYKGKIFDKMILQKFYLENKIFAMPSKTETFGLVYLEALSQGIPVLYTKNEGIDHLFNVKVGERVNPYSVKEIREALSLLLLKIDNYVMLPKQTFDRFDWKRIALKYSMIYEDAINNKLNEKDNVN